MHRIASSPLFRRWFIDATPGAWAIPERLPRRTRILSRTVLAAFVFTFALLLASTVRNAPSVTTGYAVTILIAIPILAYFYARPSFVYRPDDVEGTPFADACETILDAYRQADARADDLSPRAARDARERAHAIATEAATSAWAASCTAEQTGGGDVAVHGIAAEAAAQLGTLG